MREPFWWGEGALATVVRRSLIPASWIWRTGMALRNAAYDSGLTQARRGALPTISVGNISVGGTGKTPVTAWLASEVVRRGRTPAVVLRGFGGDEPEVHRALAPDAVVVVDPDRVRGVARARAAGGQVALLDDAFQHRRVHRDFDVVLVSADVPWADSTLPVGPLREPPGSLRRADLVLVTAKVANAAEVERCMVRVRRAGARMVGGVRLLTGDLRHVFGGETQALRVLRGSRVLCISGIANPRAFHDGLRAHGADVHEAAFQDHHAFSDADIARLLERAAAADHVVCTLKDAVKLRRAWPQTGPALWYVSQRLEPIEGTALLDEALDRACMTRDTPYR